MSSSLAYRNRDNTRLSLVTLFYKLKHVWHLSDESDEDGIYGIARRDVTQSIERAISKGNNTGAGSWTEISSQYESFPIHDFGYGENISESYTRLAQISTSKRSLTSACYASADKTSLDKKSFVLFSKNISIALGHKPSSIPIEYLKQAHTEGLSPLDAINNFFT